MPRQNLLQDGSLLSPDYQERAPPCHQCNPGVDTCFSQNFPKSPSNTFKQHTHNRVRESSGVTDPNQGSESRFGKPAEDTSLNATCAFENPPSLLSVQTLTKTALMCNIHPVDMGKTHGIAGQHTKSPNPSPTD